MSPQVAPADDHSAVIASNPTIVAERARIRAAHSSASTNSGSVAYRGGESAPPHPAVGVSVSRFALLSTSPHLDDPSDHIDHAFLAFIGDSTLLLYVKELKIYTRIKIWVDVPKKFLR